MSFADTFGPKAQQKCLHINAGTFEDLSRLGVATAEEAPKATATVELAEASTPTAITLTHAPAGMQTLSCISITKLSIAPSQIYADA